MVSNVPSTSMLSKTAGSVERARLSREQFTRILIAELSQQDPTDPVDNSTFLSQLVQLQNLESSAELTDGLKSFQRFVEMGSASSLIGKYIKGISDSGAQVEGIVQKVQMDPKGVKLVVGQEKLSLAGVQEIIPTVFNVE